MSQLKSSDDKRNAKIREAISTTQDESKQIDAIRSIRGWFGPDKDSLYYPLVQDYLDGALDLTQTVTKLSEVGGQKKSQTRDVDSMDLLYSIIHSAKRIPWKETEGHTKLIDLVKRLKNPAADDIDNFNGIPEWGMATREVLNDSPGYGAGFSLPETHAWFNVNYFLARFVKERLSGHFEPLYGLWMLRNALEEVHRDDGPDDAHTPSTAIEKYNANVPAAAMWVIVLEKTLYEFEKDMTPTNPNQGNKARGGELWKGKAEFSKERWGFWKKRFGEISEMEELNTETRDIAKEAVKAMNEAEGS